MHRLGRFAIVAAAVAAQLPVYAGAANATVARDTSVETVAVVAVPGLMWRDLTPQTTPNLWSFGQKAARGVLAVKSAEALATCADAMTTLGAGNRGKGTAALESTCATEGPSDPSAWPRLARVNRQQRYGTEPGALADALATRGLATRPDGAAGAALAAARSDGALAPGRPAVLVHESGDLYVSNTSDRTRA